MRKNALISAILLFTSLNLYSQNLSIGLKGSVDLTTINEVKSNSPYAAGMSSDDYSAIPNFQIGFVFKSELSSKIGVLIEPGFIQKGAQLKSTSKLNIRMGYLDLPLLFYYAPIKKINLELGPEVGYRLYDKAYFPDGTSIDPLINNDFDLGAIIGLSYDYNDKINIGFRYSYSLTSMEDEITVVNQYDGFLGVIHNKYYNRYFEIYLRFFLTKKQTN